MVKDSNPKGVSVGNTTTSVLGANPNRGFADFVNDSDEVIFLAKAITAVMNEGIRLNAAGGSHTIDGSNPYYGPLSAICASGSKVLTVTES